MQPYFRKRIPGRVSDGSFMVTCAVVMLDIKQQGEGQEGISQEGKEAEKDIEKVIAKPVVSADEIKPELVEYIKGELMEKMQTERSSVITEFVRNTAVSQEEFYKLQLWD